MATGNWKIVSKLRQLKRRSTGAFFYFYAIIEQVINSFGRHVMFGALIWFCFFLGWLLLFSESLKYGIHKGWKLYQFVLLTIPLWILTTIGLTAVFALISDSKAGALTVAGAILSGVCLLIAGKIATKK